MLVDTQVVESIEKILLQLLNESLQRSGVMGDIVDPLADDQVEVALYERPSKRQKSNDSCNEGPSGRSKRFYSKPRETVISDDLLQILTSVFTKPLSKEAGTELLDKYASIKGTENLLVSPKMEIGTKEDKKETWLPEDKRSICN